MTVPSARHRFSHAGRIRAMIAFLALTVLCIAVLIALPQTARATSLPTTSVNAAPAATYSGWAYITGSTAQTDWLWSATGWSAATVSPGQPVWIVPWGGGWTWGWMHGAWYAISSTSLATWTCATADPAAAPYAPATGAVVLATNSSTSSVIVRPVSTDRLQLQCSNGFRDAAGPGTFVLVSVWRGVTSLGSGYVSLGSLVATTVPAPTCGSSLQSRIDGAVSGSAINLTGCAYSGNAIVNKPLTVIGGTVHAPAGSYGIRVTANNVTLDGVHIAGAQASTYNGGEDGVNVEASVTAPVRGLVIRNCEIDHFGDDGMRLNQVAAPGVNNNRIHDIVYTGVLLMSAQGGSVSGNLIQRVGVLGSAANGNNAYGIAISRGGLSLAEQPQSRDVTVSGNTVETVPTWHGLDTHAGIRITFANNTVRGAMRALFITSDSNDHQASDITVTGNRFETPAPAVTTNLVAITLYKVITARLQGNVLVGWPAGDDIYDYEGLSIGVSSTGNTIS